MIRALERIFNDIASGKHVEAYVITTVALVIAVLSIIEDVIPLELQMAVILAAMALLVFKTTEPENAEVDLDSVLHNRQAYGPFREFIRDAHTLWIYGPSSVNVLTNPSDIEREVLNKGGKVRVLLQDPTQKYSIEILEKQLDANTRHLLHSDIQRSVVVLKTLQERGYDVEYRFLAYSPGFSVVVVNANEREGRTVVEFYGFTNEMTDNRMHLKIHRHQSKYWFDYWSDQFEKMWQSAREMEVET